MEDEFEFDDSLEECPYCGMNTLREGDKMCDACAAGSAFEVAYYARQNIDFEKHQARAEEYVVSTF